MIIGQQRFHEGRKDNKGGREEEEEAGRKKRRKGEEKVDITDIEGEGKKGKIINEQNKGDRK